MSASLRRRPDEADRRAIVEKLDTNLLVEAAAGTGKTTSLVDRMLALVRNGKAPIERLCAVTYTVKAAAQLKEKFQLRLESSLAAEQNPVARRRLEAALEGLNRCFIGTIHSFCARLLRERPVEAGVDPQFQEIDETEDLLLRRESWERHKQTLFVEGWPILPELMKYGIPIDLLHDAYQCLATNPDVEPAAAGRLPEPRFERERKLVLEFLERAAPQVPAKDPDVKSDGLQTKLRSALRHVENHDLARIPELVALFEKLQGSAKVVQYLWPDKARAKKLGSDFEALQDDVVLPALMRWREFLYPIAIEAVTPAAAEFRRLRRERGVLNFNDLLLFARDLLRDRPEARSDFQNRFTPILVDEFQDTDPIQAEVLLFLTGRQHDEKDWRKLEPIPGSLFVVGDPKQSIYRFRRADIEVYERVRERIRASGGEVVKLTTNFRSSPEVCAWVNGVFGTVFPERATRQQAANAPLSPERQPAGQVSGAYRLEVASAGKRYEDVARADSIRIASWIRGALDAGYPLPSGAGRPAEPADFLVLFRYKKRMDIYAKELEARGIPYEIAGGGAFSESEDLQDLLPLLETVADPDDPVSLVASLRGPFFGVDDDALYRFRRAGGRFHLFGPVPPSTDPRITAALDILRDVHGFSERLPPGAAIAAAAEALGAIAYGGAQELGGTRAGNLLKAIAIARVLSSRGEPFGAVVRNLRALAESSETEEMSTRPGEAGAVRLMTLHRAKGLEAPIVFLADPSGEFEASVRWCVDREAGKPCAWLRVVQKDKRGRGEREIARPIGWDEREITEKLFAAAEDDRLLYVAATRAADVLVVSVGPNDAKNPWGKLVSAVARTLPNLAARLSVVPPPGPEPDLPRELERARLARRSRRMGAGRPSYAVAPVTLLAHGPGERPFQTRTGRGMSWGRVIHRLLEGAMKDPALDLRLYAANLLVEEERPADDLDEAVRLAEAVRHSGLWKRALVAKRRFTEIPFALMTAKDDLGLSDGPSEVLLQGAIDLVFEEEPGWTLVDYKSDTIVGNLDELVSFYSPQIEMYRRYWEELTGSPTKAGLFFVQTGHEVWPEAR
jgi:ATP-dependent helicase/nuclease subunit A